MSPSAESTGRAVRIIGFALLVPTGVLYLASGLVVPMPWLVGLWLVWIALAVFAVRQRAKPWRVLATPFVAVLVWVAVVSLGEAVFDWTA